MKFVELEVGQMFTWHGILMMRTNPVVITEAGQDYKLRRCVNLQTGYLHDQPDDTLVKYVPHDSDLINFLKAD